MKYLIGILGLSLLVGCGTLFSKDDVKNYGGNSNVTVKQSGDIVIETKQPDNPNTAARQTVEVRPDNTMLITQETGGAYENKLGKLKGVFGMAKLYHIAAIACFIVGGVIIGTPLPYLSNRTGLCVCGSGVVLLVAGSIMPDISNYVAIAGAVAAIIGIWYIYHKHILHKEPPSSDV